MKRPLAATPESIKAGNSTGGELMYADTLKEYVGEYHVYKNGAIYSDAEFNVQTSKQLMPLIKPMSNPINQTYLKLSKKLFSQYRPPTQYFKILDPVEYQNGKTERYIIQRINEPYKLYEVDFEAFKSVNVQNQPGINGFLYRRARVVWTLTGDVNLVRQLNQDAILRAEETIPGLGTFLLTNPLEFVRQEYTGGDVNGLFTSGGEFKDTDGNNYVGLYHYHADKGPMKGPTHTSVDHERLIPYGGASTTVPSDSPRPTGTPNY
jgi:hypothetical protein